MFYHWWIYVYVINTTWFMWGVVWTMVGLNFAMPVIVWFTMSSRNPMWDKKQAQQEDTKADIKADKQNKPADQQRV